MEVFKKDIFWNIEEPQSGSTQQRQDFILRWRFQCKFVCDLSTETLVTFLEFVHSLITTTENFGLFFYVAELKTTLKCNKPHKSRNLPHTDLAFDTEQNIH